MSAARLLAAALLALLSLPARADDAPPGYALAQGGIGLVISERRESFARVQKVLPGGPAAAAGVQEGDVLATIDGKPAAEVDQAAPGRGLALALRGPVGAKVAFTVTRGGKTLAFALARADLSPLMQALRESSPPPTSP